MIHVLKCWSGPFQAMVDGVKTFEIRKNDRNFRVGDVLQLNEWDHVKREHLERVMQRRVTYIVHGGEYGLPPDLCVMGIEPLLYRIEKGRTP